MNKYIYYLTQTGKWGCIRDDELSKIVPTYTDGKSVVNIQKTDGTLIENVSTIDFNKNQQTIKRNLVELIDHIHWHAEKCPVYRVTVCPGTEHEKDITVFTCEVIPTSENAKYSHIIKKGECTYLFEEDFNNTEEVISNMVAIKTVYPEISFFGKDKLNVRVFIGTEHQMDFIIFPTRTVYTGRIFGNDALIIPDSIYDEYVEKKTGTSKNRILKLASERALQINH